MANLLTPAEEAQIKQGLFDVMDTFADVSVILHLCNNGVNMSAWGEDSKGATTTDFTVRAQVIWGRSKAKSDANMGGAFDNADAMVFIPISFLATLGLVLNNAPRINPTIDTVSINGVEYVIDAVSQQGGLLLDSIDLKETNCVLAVSKNVKYAT